MWKEIEIPFGEGETAEKAIPRQESIKGHGIPFAPTCSTNAHNREEGVHLAVQVPEEEFGGDATGAAQEHNWVD